MCKVTAAAVALFVRQFLIANAVVLAGKTVPAVPVKVPDVTLPVFNLTT
jgi:hypothetical protein